MNFYPIIGRPDSFVGVVYQLHFKYGTIERSKQRQNFI